MQELVRPGAQFDRCPWTGEAFSVLVRGGNAKRFASDSARAEAHKAARQYTEALIEHGFLTWDALRLWYRARKGVSVSYTTLPAQDAD